MIFDLIALGLEIRPGGLWGLLPYFAGLDLIFWGYATLEKQKGSGAEESNADGAKALITEAKPNSESFADHNVM